MTTEVKCYFQVIGFEILFAVLTHHSSSLPKIRLHDSNGKRFADNFSECLCPLEIEGNPYGEGFSCGVCHSNPHPKSEAWD